MRLLWRALQAEAESPLRVAIEFGQALAEREDRCDLSRIADISLICVAGAEACPLPQPRTLDRPKPI